MKKGNRRILKYAGTVDRGRRKENSGGNRVPEAGCAQGSDRGGQRGAAHGDLSENFEYHAAKKDKNINESRIRYLERMLKTANVITDYSKADEVGLDKTVEVYCEDDDETETYRIVTSVRGNSLSGLISIESPLGKALMGHKVGDRVYIKVNEQFGYYVEIRSISEAAGEEEDQIRKF